MPLPNEQPDLTGGQAAQWQTIGGATLNIHSAVDGFTHMYAKSSNNEEEFMDVNVTRLNKIFRYSELEPLQSSGIRRELVGFQDAISKCGAKVRPCGSAAEITRNNEVMIGVEIEIEGSTNIAYPSAEVAYTTPVGTQAFSSCWTVTNDDSLRDGGVEFITRAGLRARDLPNALQILELYIRSYYGKAVTNYRCGTHVHVNVRDFTVAQYLNFVMLYTLFENLFYKASGDRRRNIFCVPIRSAGNTLEPLFRTIIHKPRPTYDDLRSSFRHFKKYMALNLLPTAQPNNHDYPLGTIEFRHHEGTSNPTSLSRWVQMILEVHRAAQLLTVEEFKELIFGLNKRSNYLDFAAKVFGSAPSLVNYSRQDLIDDMYEGSAFLKEVYINAKGHA